MAKTTVICDYCGQPFEKSSWELHQHNFCCKEHLYKWNSIRCSKYNRSDNPMKYPGGVMESRIKRGDMQRGRGEGRAYQKLLGRYAHRVIAERMIGRQLKPEEVVHHIDGNKLNNCPENLIVLTSQSVHAKLHATLRQKRW